MPSVSRYTSHIKEYGTDIVITDPPPGIRTGMTANVTILSEQIKDDPNSTTAVYRLDGNAYCLVGKRENELNIRKIKLGPHNLTMTVVTEGLKVDEQVVLNPDYFRSLFESDQQSDLVLK